MTYKNINNLVAQWLILGIVFTKFRNSVVSTLDKWYQL